MPTSRCDELFGALGGARTAVSVFDRAGKYVYANRAMAALLGASPRELCGAPYGAREGPTFEEAFRSVVADDLARTVTVPLADGRKLDVELAPGPGHVVAFWRPVEEQLDDERHHRARAEHERATWKRLLDDAPAQVSMLEGPELRYAFVNAAWKAAFGDRDVLGKMPSEAFPEFRGSPIQDAIHVAYREGRRLDLAEQPFELATADGRLEERFMTFRVQPYRDADGRVAGVMIASFDVTEQARSRLRLEALIAERDRLVVDLDAEHQRLSRMFSRSLVGTITWNLDGRIFDANDAFLRTIGYTREDLRRGLVDWQRLTPPEYAAADKVAVESLLERGMHEPFEKEYVRRDGSRVPVLLSAAFFEGSRREGLSYVVDLSIVKRAEAALRATEQRFRSLIEATSQTVWTTDPEGAVAEPSPSWTAFTGQSEEQRAGFGWLEAIHPDDRERVREQWLAAVRRREVCDLEYRLRKRDGTFAITSFKAVPILGDRGVVREWVGANTDVTGQRNAAAERERLLTAAQAASRAKDEFLGTLSHELRTPLNAIIGWASLLRGGVVSPEQRDRALEIIDRNARAQAHLVEDLLDVSRISREKLVMERTPVDFGAVVDSVLDGARPSFEAKRVSLAVHVDPNAIVLGDADRLQQVASNLLSNALKFTRPSGHVAVRVEGRGTSVVLSVADDGRGIAPDVLPHVFEPFWQADGSSSRAAGGLGLGLAIVRTIVELHGGRVWAESAGPEQGATFRVSIPALSVSHADGGSVTPSMRRDRGKLSGVRVLVVDDEPDARALLQMLLEGFGAQVRTAASTSEALDVMKRNRFDVLLSDLAMPGEDGYSLIRRMRSGGARIPAVAVTAFARGEDRTAALRAGYDVHVAKPVEPNQLVTTIAGLVAALSGR